MKFLIVLAVTVAFVAAAESDAPIVKSVVDIKPDGSYGYAYETGNGILAQEEGVLKNSNSEYPSIDVQGSYSYPAPDGTLIQTVYKADENGFQPQGAHLPVSPPIPEAILRALKYTAEYSPPPSVQFAQGQRITASQLG